MTAAETVTNYGAIGDGETLETEAIQSAIDACADGGGGTVRLPAGTYRTGTIFLRSHVMLHLDGGAMLLGSAEKEDYDSATTNHTSLLLADDCEKVAIAGDGVIHGNGTEFMHMDTMLDPMDDSATAGRDYRPRQEAPLTTLGPEDQGVGDGPVATREWRPSRTLLYYDCEDVRLEDVTIREAPCWTVHFLGCDGVDVRGVDIRNEIRIPNSDGINPVNTSNVTISNCSIYTGDDAISPKTVAGTGADGPTENVTVTNCTLTSRSCAIKLGSESDLDMRDHTYSNVVVRDSNRALGIQHRGIGDIENILYSDIVVETRLHTGNWWGQSEPITVKSIQKDPDIDLGTVSGVRFRNVVARSEGGAVLWGTDGSLRDVGFDDVSLHLQDSDLAAIKGGNLDIRPTSVRPSIEEKDIPGLYARGVEDLSLEDVTVTCEDELPEYYASAVMCEGCDNLEINGFYGCGTENVTLSVEDSHRVTVRNSMAAPNTETFLEISGSEGRLFSGNDTADAEQTVVGGAGFTYVGNCE